MKYYYYTEKWGGWVLIKAKEKDLSYMILSELLEHSEEIPDNFLVQVLDKDAAWELLKGLRIPCNTGFAEVKEALERFEDNFNAVIFGDIG